MNIDQFAYKLKQHCRPVFNMVEVCCGYYIARKYRKAITAASDQAVVAGQIAEKTALIRLLKPADIDDLFVFFDGLPESHFTFFRPHGFNRKDVEKVLRRPYYMAFGLFVNDRLAGYSLFKLYPGKKVFFGRMIDPSLTGCGVGKFLSLYLQWQSHIIGFRMRGTINMKNSPSVGSHKAVGGFEILGELPNGYTLIEFPPEKCPVSPPALNL